MIQITTRGRYALRAMREFLDQVTLRDLCDEARRLDLATSPGQGSDVGAITPRLSTGFSGGRVERLLSPRTVNPEGR